MFFIALLSFLISLVSIFTIKRKRVFFVQFLFFIPIGLGVWAVEYFWGDSTFDNFIN